MTVDQCIRNIIKYKVVKYIIIIQDKKFTIVSCNYSDYKWNGKYSNYKIKENKYYPQGNIVIIYI